MTTLVWIKKENMIILAADSRASSSGTYIYQAECNKICDMWSWAIAFSGQSIFLEVFNVYKEDIKKDFCDINKDNLLSLIVYIWKLFDEYGIEKYKRDDDSLKYTYGWVVINNKWDLFSITWNPSLSSWTTIVAEWSGCEFAEWAAMALYNSNLSLEEIATQAIQAASKFDIGTDDNIKYITYTLGNESTT